MFDEPMAPSEAAPYADISPEVEAIVLKALQKDRAYRFQTMEELSLAILDVGTGADPVAVIPEARARPISEGRPTAFLARSSSGPSSRMSRLGGEVTIAEPRRRSRGLLVTVAAGFALLGGATTLMLLGDDPPPAPTVVVGTPQGSGPPMLAGPRTLPVAIVAPTPEPVTPAQVDAHVYVTCNVPAEVIDAADGTVLGATGDGGFTLSQAAGPRKVVVRAAGHDDLALELEPVAERSFEAVLKPKKKLAGKAGKPGDGKKPALPVAVDPRPSETKTIGSMGLKNPFETRAP